MSTSNSNNSHLTLGKFPAYIQKQLAKLSADLQKQPKDKYGRTMNYIVKTGFGPNRAERQAAQHRSSKHGSKTKGRLYRQKLADKKTDQILGGRAKLEKLLARAGIQTNL